MEDQVSKMLISVGDSLILRFSSLKTVFTYSSFLRGERLSILERTFGASDDCNDHLRAFLQR